MHVLALYERLNRALAGEPEPVSAEERAALRAGHDPSWWGVRSGRVVWEVWYQTSGGKMMLWETFVFRSSAAECAARIGGWFPWVEIRRAVH